MVGFQQAAIKIENEEKFEALRAAVERAFRPETVEKFLQRLQAKSLRVRDLDSILAGKLLDDQLVAAGTSAQSLYQSLTLSDQAQMREFYLSKIEAVDQALRHKFKKLYQYY